MAASTAELVDQLTEQAVGLVRDGEKVALEVVATLTEKVRTAAPQVQELLAKVDLVDTREAVDSAFRAADRVIGTQRAFVGELLGAVFGRTSAGEAPTEAA